MLFRSGKTTGSGYPRLRVDELGRKKNHRGQLRKFAVDTRLAQKRETGGKLRVQKHLWGKLNLREKR